MTKKVTKRTKDNEADTAANDVVRLRPESRFRDRIRGLERLRAGDMEEHPGNWRLHPGKQVGAVTGLLVEVGKVDALLAFPVDGLGPDGDFSQLMMFDGHLRRSIDPEEVWPVIVTDLTRAEADKMILTMDATAGMAEADPAKLDALLRGVQTACQEVADTLGDMAEDAGIISPDESDLPDINETTRHTVTVPYDDDDIPCLCSFLDVDLLPGNTLGKVICERIKAIVASRESDQSGS